MKVMMMAFGVMGRYIADSYLNINLVNGIFKFKFKDDDEDDKNKVKDANKDKKDNKNNNNNKHSLG